MNTEKFYIKDTGDFLENLKNLGNILYNIKLVAADVVDLYPSIPHGASFQALYEKLEGRTDKKFYLLTFLKWLNLYWKIISLNLKLKRFSRFLEHPLEISLLPYGCLFMNRIKNEFLDLEIVKL